MNRYKITYANGNQDEVTFHGMEIGPGGALSFFDEAGDIVWAVNARAWNFVEYLGPAE